ncbi:MAG: hypothetical protein ACRDJX_08035 [Solirubrobacteraceae bacterium]
MLPFWISISLLSLVQGLLVALSGALSWAGAARLRSRRWAVIPPLSVLAFVFGARAAESASAQGLTYLALVAVPVLAALALGWLVWGCARGAGRRALRASAVAPLFALAWLDRGGLAGEAAAVCLSGLSCVALGVLLAGVTPPRWLAGGIVAMALADTALVVSDLLQRPNDALNAARPAANLPQLQSAVLGSAVMGYGDLFIAGVLGGLLAATFGRRLQLRAALLVAILALVFDLLFLLVDELPATVPVALALIAVLLRRRWRFAGAPEALASPGGVAAEHPRSRAPLARLSPER